MNPNLGSAKQPQSYPIQSTPDQPRKGQKGGAEAPLSVDSGADRRGGEDLEGGHKDAVSVAAATPSPSDRSVVSGHAPEDSSESGSRQGTPRRRPGRDGLVWLARIVFVELLRRHFGKLEALAEVVKRVVERMG